jgi:hypothetical protein
MAYAITGIREEDTTVSSMNITHATLFPGLDGLACSLAYELEFHWRYDPQTQGAEKDGKTGTGA